MHGRMRVCAKSIWGAEMLLSVENLSQRYGTAKVLNDIAFGVEQGACCALLGRNGAGKTTLLRTIMGLLPSPDGAIVFDGADITRAAPHIRARRGIGYVPQGRDIFSDLSVGQNIDIVMAANKVADRQAAKSEVIALFPVLGEMWHRRGGDLSGGQQQQLAIARALAMRPKLLLLDEPTEGVQPSIVQTIEDVIRSLRGHLSILLVEQYYDFASSLADNYVVLDRGHVVEQGRRDQMNAQKIGKFLTV
nr:urea ABC transporter ATP-binding subunit UrtE [Hoeflea sp.]